MNLLSGVERVFSLIYSDSFLVRLSIIEKSFDDWIWMHLLTLILNRLWDKFVVVINLVSVFIASILVYLNGKFGWH